MSYIFQNKYRVNTLAPISIAWFEHKLYRDLLITHLDESLANQAIISVRRVLSSSWTRRTLTDDVKPFVNVIDNLMTSNVLPFPTVVADIIISYSLDDAPVSDPFHSCCCLTMTQLQIKIG
jgi:hypothetical protein